MKTKEKSINTNSNSKSSYLDRQVTLFLYSYLFERILDSLLNNFL